MGDPIGPAAGKKAADGPVAPAAGKKAADGGCPDPGRSGCRTRRPCVPAERTGDRDRRAGTVAPDARPDPPR
ncbi:hypothetical protein GCM10010251_00900 [Streptomyces aurantiogriseus]|uniref:Uncharacterized protein n=1 Tax=Streptomyces aurantiogriseus TaxID=66870 RepID=A0A918BSY8_9ACTN|nr:hypothetical protein GCM10010251_00900 [Streptomyces aurantiogriseus]